jgi:SAM-dependent methyltransferase
MEIGPSGWGAEPPKETQMQILKDMAANPQVFTFLRRLVENNFRGEKQVIRRELSDLRPSSRLLDLGCGPGTFAPLFSHCQYFGIDIDPTYIAFARKHFPGNFEVMDATRMNFPDGHFDYILVQGVLHHLPDALAVQVLREMKRVIRKPGKMVILEDVNVESSWDLPGNLMRRLDIGAFIRKKQEYRHLFEQQFPVASNYRMRTGLVTYEVFIVRL